jgi:hypothetical protein
VFVPGKPSSVRPSNVTIGLSGIKTVGDNEIFYEIVTRMNCDSIALSTDTWCGYRAGGSRTSRGLLESCRSEAHVI